MSGRKLLDPKSIRLDVIPQEIVSIGIYAIRFSWSDGHNSGIYSFNDLRAIGQNKADQMTPEDSPKADSIKEPL